MRKAIILRRRATARQITLPNGETFVATYERTNRRNLPRNVTVRRTRRAQKGGSLLSSGLRKLTNLRIKFEAKKFFKKGLDVGSRAITSEIGK